MATTALTAHIRLPSRAHPQRDATCGLGFDEPGGPLLAVCALVGGSGASTLAFCLARQTARESQAPVLLAEPDAHRADLAALTEHATPFCLTRLARELADGRAPAQPFAQIEPGLRLVASQPGRGPECGPAHLEALLGEARAAHGLVVVDCGTAWDTPRPVLDAATHIAWTVTTTESAIARAQLLLASDALPAPGRTRELLVALATQHRPRASVRALRRLATQRCERLVLTPHSDAIAHGQLDDPVVALGRTLTGVAPVLRRTR